MLEENKINSINDIETKDKIEDIPTEPCRAICEVCAKEVTTFVKNEYNIFIWILVISVLYFYGPLYSIPILFITVPLFKNVTHNCPFCDELLMTKKFFPIKIKKGICSLQYWNCIIIMNIIYIGIIVFLIFILGIYLNVMYHLKPHDHNSHDHNHEIDETVSKYYNSQLTWEDLIHDCGAYVIIENSAKANEIFNRKYHKQIVEWKGYFLNSFVQISPFGGNADHLMNINVRMIPSESLKDPDLFLSMDSKKFNDYKNVIQSLNSGDAIKFRASFESIGNEWRSHHLHLIHIEKTDDFIEEDKKIILFQGVSFNITGHLKAEKELDELKSDTNNINLNNSINSTQNI